MDALFENISQPQPSDKIAALFSIQEPSASSPVTKLFEAQSFKYTREEILRQFRLSSDKGIIPDSIKKLRFFSEISIMPEGIRNPGTKMVLFNYGGKKEEKNTKPKPRIKEHIKYTSKNISKKPYKETNKLKRQKEEYKSKIEDLFENDPNPSDKNSNILDLFKPNEESKINTLLQNDISDNKKEELLEKRPEIVNLVKKTDESGKIRKGIDQLFENSLTSPDLVSPEKDEPPTKVLLKVDELFEKEKKEESKINQFLEYAGKDKKLTDEIWFYKDLEEQIQGPFNSEEMFQWNEMGYFFENLMVRLQSEKEFRPLNDIIKDKTHVQGMHIKVNDIFENIGDNIIHNITKESEEKIKEPVNPKLNILFK